MKETINPINVKVPQELINYRLQAKSILAFCTNQAYANNQKFSYSIEFKKGEQAITYDNVNYIKHYYTFSLILLNKNTSIIGQRIELYVTHYPISMGENSITLEKLAYKDFFTNAIASLINNTYAMYINSLQKDLVKPEDVTSEDAEREAAIIKNRIESGITEEEKPKLIITK
jgi:hypothetical protein